MPSEWKAGRQLFLMLLGVVYLVAFLSFYIQAPGLYGENETDGRACARDGLEGTLIAVLVIVIQMFVD